MNWAGGFLAGWLASYLPTLAAVVALALAGVLKVELKRPTQSGSRNRATRPPASGPPMTSLPPAGGLPAGSGKPAVTVTAASKPSQAGDAGAP